jgi:C1A family cysteine protease
MSKPSQTEDKPSNKTESAPIASSAPPAADEGKDSSSASPADAASTAGAIVTTKAKPFYRHFKLNYKFDRRKHKESPYKATYRGILPRKVDLRERGLPPVRDQGSLGCCVSVATSNALQYSLMRFQDPVFTPAALFIYYNGRTIEGNPADEDTGLFVRDGMASVHQFGVCSENNWPYDIVKFADKPPASCYTAAKQHKLNLYAPVPQTLNDMKSVLAEGWPIVFGFEVFPSFMTQEVAETGIAPMPNTSEEDPEGGHCILCVGYDDDTKRFLLMNSWSTSWGQEGFCTVPYAMLTNGNICSDFWVIKGFRL